jgi:hypothetical protein
MPHRKPGENPGVWGVPLRSPMSAVNGTKSDLILRDGPAALLSMKLQRLCPHAEEARSAVSKYEVAPIVFTDSI